MDNSSDLLDSIDTNAESDIPYQEGLKGKVFIADSEQEAVARFDAWMNRRTEGKRKLLGVFDQTIGKNISVITVVYCDIH